jgi:TRAP-type C4-dicarboxylate transport system permease large subunit
MSASVDTHLITVVAVVALIGWRMVARIRRVIGRQRLSPARPWFTVLLFPLILLLVLFTGLAHPMTTAAMAAGVVVGIVLGLYGTRLTRFEVTPAGLFYTPNAHLGVALSVLLVLRLGYRFVMLQLGGQPFDPQSMQLGNSPLTMAIFGTLAGYYVTYAIGLLRWRASVGKQAPAEH